MRRAFAVVGTCAVAAIIAAGCGSDDDGDSGGGSDDAFDGSVKVGAIVPLTGELAPFGKAGNESLELAVEQANEALGEAGLDGEVELFVEDGETKEDAAKAAAEKLVREDDVSCIVGDWASSSTLAVAQSTTIDEGVPLISPASTAGSITTLDDDGLVYRTVPSDNLQAEVLADAIAEDLGNKGTVAISALNNAYGTGLAEALDAALTGHGLTVSEPVLVDPDAPQADSAAADLVKDKPDAFVIVDYPNSFLKLGPELVKTGDWDPAKTWGTDGMKDTTLPNTGGAKLTEGMRGTAPTSAEAPAAEAFDKLWTASDLSDRQTYDADNFDAVMACVLAAVAAGSNDPGDIAEELRDVSGGGEKYTFENLADAMKAAQDGDDIDYEGAASPLDWDENGDPSAAFYEIWGYTGGKLTTIKVIPFAEGGGDDAGDDAAEEPADADDSAGTDGADATDTTETP